MILYDYNILILYLLIYHNLVILNFCTISFLFLQLLSHCTFGSLLPRQLLSLLLVSFLQYQIELQLLSLENISLCAQKLVFLLFYCSIRLFFLYYMYITFRMKDLSVDQLLLDICTLYLLIDILSLQLSYYQLNIRLLLFVFHVKTFSCTKTMILLYQLYYFQRLYLLQQRKD